jgi:predicted ATPase
LKENLLVNKKIVISGGPGSGKTTLVNLLINNDYYCFEEFSRSVIDAGKVNGIQNFFETEPLTFSQIIFQERKKQYLSAAEIDHMSVFPYVFFDRGLHDVVAYLDHQGNPADEMSIEIQKYPYDLAILLPPWKDIYENDEHRMESFEESVSVFESIKKTYEKFSIPIVEIPFNTPNSRIMSILKILKNEDHS